ncbi:MBL fold metallo-hydrolase [Bacillaceae bacterium]
MKFSVLASGSTGNAVYIRTAKTSVLVDAGLSGKQLEEIAAQVNIDLSSLDAILVTHEHADHIKGVGVLARRYDLPVYTNSATWEVLDPLVGKLTEEQKQILETGEALHFDDLTVESFGVSHDGAEPMGFCFYEKDAKLSLVTDLGYVSKKIKEQVRDSDALIFEANHDIEMLRMSSYPWNIKRRILSDVGHLSNDACGEALCDVLEGNKEKVYLAHLSKDNNMTELARLTVKNILEESGFSVGEDVVLYDTYPDRATKIDEI